MPDFSTAGEVLGAIAKYLPWMAGLIGASGFFSGSEAAFFSLTLSQRRELKKAGRSEMSLELLRRPERLLMGILFWNLAINLAYFTLASKAALEVQSSSSMAAGVTLGALLTIIVFGEFVPKSLAVTYPLVFIRLVTVPLALGVRVLDGCIPIIKLVSEASRRLVWPGLRAEPYLELADLDRAVEFSPEESELFEHERQVLRNIIRLSEIRVEEWMRPRTQYRTFAPPVSLEQLGGEKTPSGYMLVTDDDGHEIESVIDLSAISATHLADIESLRQPLVPVPWCATVADALQRMRYEGRRVAVVVNEFGEAIGILTWEEVFEAILQSTRHRSHRALAKAEILPEGPGVWLATGTTKIRRLERVLDRRLTVQNLTIGGVISDQLHRLAEKGDICEFDGLHLEVIDAEMRGEILVRIRVTSHHDGSGP